MSLYFIVALFYHTAEKAPDKPRKQISPTIARTKRITPKAIKSSTVMFPSLLGVPTFGTDLQGIETQTREALE